MSTTASCIHADTYYFSFHHAQTFARIHKHRHAFTCTDRNTHIQTHTHTNTHIHTHAHTDTHPHAFAHIHAHSYAHIHTPAHTQMQSLFLLCPVSHSRTHQQLLVLQSLSLSLSHLSQFNSIILSFSFRQILRQQLQENSKEGVGLPCHFRRSVLAEHQYRDRHIFEQTGNRTRHAT